MPRIRRVADSLHQRIASRVDAWRSTDYFAEDHPAISEILEWSREPDTEALRYLRGPQFRALEVYWYLRLCEDTAHVFDLYRGMFTKQSELLDAFGLEGDVFREIVLDDGADALWERVRADDEFVRKHHLEALRETLTLGYPSYILALAMGAGKTILIGAIIATEFAMAMEYPDGPFVQNALVFAPGTTIIESLRELAEVPYDRILPPRMFKPFAASVKLTFTRDGETDVPVGRGSVFNLIVTNTEKIRIQKRTAKKAPRLTFLPAEDPEAEIANLRLQTIASLPHLGVFSDEAHHTYGQALDTAVKRVRQTVDYLAKNTNVVAVVNTTGTPYFKRQPLRDVVVWYGLSEGIRDNILKDPAGNIQAYDFEGDAAPYLEEVVGDFFKTYRDVSLPDGAPAKIAIYFPQTDDLDELHPVVDRAVASAGLSAAHVLVNTSKSTKAEIDAFNRLNDPGSPHRVILLVNKGTEGWNCPSLFACALARKLRTSNNFVLQAATRCLRQVPGNTLPARIYLSQDNFGILDRQLQETYGESIAEVNRAVSQSIRTMIRLRKVDIPPLVMKRIVRTVTPAVAQEAMFLLKRPDDAEGSQVTRRTYTLGEQRSTYGVLSQTGSSTVITAEPATVSVYAAAVDLSSRYRVDLWSVLEQLRELYDNGAVPETHLEPLASQIEEKTRHYEVTEEEHEVALALVKPSGFTLEMGNDGAECYVAEISYPKSREHLLLSWESLRDRNPGNFGFHYTPYNFDSNPEASFFEQVLRHLNLRPDDVDDLYFTGAITDAAKTDFFIEYRDEDGRMRRYVPDFVIRRKDGKVYIVEVKREYDRDHPIQGENGAKAMAIRRLADVDPERLRYEMIFTSTDQVTADQTAGARAFVEGTS
jgi:type III restriction enzyme